MKLFYLRTLCVALAACHGLVNAANETIDPNAPLRAVEIPGQTIYVPDGSFSESALVMTLCQPDSAREPIIDRANLNYLSNSAFGRTMEHGRQILEIAHLQTNKG